MRVIFKFIVAITSLVLLGVITLQAENHEEFQMREKAKELTTLMEEVTAHTECFAYIGHTFRDYSLADFIGETDAKEAKNQHFLKAQLTAQKLVEYGMKTKIQGKYLVFEKGNQKCMGEMCFEKKEYVEFFFIAAALAMAEELVKKKEISCPEGAWHPCKGGEPVDNWGYKAGKQYKDKNCKLLLR